MQRSLSQVLLEILDIMQYTKDKQKFVAEFEQINNLETVINLIERLPVEEQKQIERIQDQPAKVMEYFSSEAYQQERSKVSTSALNNFLETTAPVLTIEQKEKIREVISSSV